MASGSALAQVTNLEDLIVNDGTITVGNLVFSNFEYLATGTAPDAENVNVVGITDDDLGHFGLRFQGGFIDLPGGGASDALITYTVETADPDFVIIGAGIQGNPDIFGPGTALAAVTDTFLSQIEDANLSIFDDGNVQQLADSIFFDEAFATIDVQKDIVVIAGETNLAAGISFVHQTYYLAEVPEPTSLALMGIGSLLVMRRRRGQ